MGTNVRRAIAKKQKAPALPSRDTWPVPPPESAMVPILHDTAHEQAHDTIRTPPPHPNDVDEPEIPTSRGIDIARILAGHEP